MSNTEKKNQRSKNLVVTKPIQVVFKPLEIVGEIWKGLEKQVRGSRML
jgi:hypothetical protein